MKLRSYPPVLIGGFFISMLLSACAQYRVIGQIPASKIKPEFLLIYMVHGDGNYSYYNNDGTKHWADVDAVAQALQVAKASQNGEVIVFHQKAASGLLGLNGGSVFYHYRFGFKIQQKEYSRRGLNHGMKAESRIIKNLEAQAPIRFFAYFGHEIVEKGGKGYSGSYPTQNFSLSEFTSDLRRFTWPDSSDEKPFSLVILSFCHSGNRATTTAMAPFTDYLIGSPTLLHLSYFSTLAFGALHSALPAKLEKQDVPELAARISTESFERLQKSTQTEIAIATFKMATKKMDPTTMVDSITRLNTVSGESFPGTPSKCIDLHYRPARFGMNQKTNAPIEWECP